MLALLQEIKERAPEEHPNLSDKKARPWRERVAALSPTAPDVIKWELYLKLGEAEQNVGRDEEAIRVLSQAYEILPHIAPDLGPGWANRLRFRLGQSYLRLAEARHHQMHPSPEDSLFPIQGGGVHVDKTLARKAIEFFTEQLDDEKEEVPYATGRWLLNLAYMAAGAYPAEVPPAYLISPKAFASDVPFPRFPNVAPKAGVATYSYAGGVVADDFDLDGDVDLLVSNHDPAGQLRLFVNDGRGRFTERTDEAGLTGILGGLNMVQADYDNDGDVDVLMLRGGWLGREGRHPKSLLRNHGDGTFTDVTFESGLGEVHYPTQTASWGDYDNDGDLDLYVGNETGQGVTAPCQLFVNRGDGTFVDVAPAAGVTNDRFTKSVIWGDYDADRLLDLYVSNIDGANRLYHNEGNGSFIDVAPQLGVTLPNQSFVSWFWDFDNDGNLDLFVSAYDAQVTDIVAAALGEKFTAHLPRLYRGDGHGGFEEVAADYNLKRPNAPMGANFGDLDNDGYLDFYLGTGFMAYHGLMPNVMYHNRAGRAFDDVTTAGGFGHLQKGHGIAFADVDGDGDQDVFAQMGGALPGDAFDDALFENPGFGNRWIEIQLVGVTSNRSGIGARIRAQVREGGRSRSIYKYVNSGGTFGANPLRQTLGLGKADRVELLEVFWPTSNRTETFRDVPRDRRFVVIEGAARLWTLPR